MYYIYKRISNKSGIFSQDDNIIKTFQSALKHINNDYTANHDTL